MVAVEDEMPGHVENIELTSVRAQNERWSILSDDRQTWSVVLKWDISSAYVKSCAICLFNEDGAHSAPIFCQPSDLDHGQLNIVQAPGSFSKNSTSSFYGVTVQCTTFSNRVFTQYAEMLTLDLTAPVG